MQQLEIGKNNKAFTLIELLVVLVIIGIILAVAVMSFGDFGQARKQHLAIAQLQQSLKAAQEQAILQPVVLGLSFSTQGYHYYRYWLDPSTQIGSWINIPDDVLSQPRAFATATSIQLNDAHNKTYSLTKAHSTPFIYCLPNGTVTPFRVTITFADHSVFTLQSDGAGGMSLEKK